MGKIVKVKVAFLGLALSLLFLVAGGLAENKGSQIEIGFSFGLRTLNNADLKNVYGSGINFFPNVVLVWKGLMIGGGYEAGFKRNGLIGLFQEPAELAVSGPEIFAGYQFNLKSFAPYARLGCGFYSYKQVINSPYVSNYPVNGKKTGLILAGGIKFYPVKQLLISAEVKYGSLKVKPYDQVVDVGGLRLNGGLGIWF
ncbi:MAG: hypothetical protein ACPLZD_01805 [Candidatus Saccharicenans sp.]|nr:MAG: hypothetical protein C0168_04165 [Candidatus Aminicenantes bacterium]HEK84828.1 hypothetical protein [Candidatus Aminicenantes bacterium]